MAGVRERVPRKGDRGLLRHNLIVYLIELKSRDNESKCSRTTCDASDPLLEIHREETIRNTKRVIVTQLFLVALLERTWEITQAPNATRWGHQGVISDEGPRTPTARHRLLLLVKPLQWVEWVPKSQGDRETVHRTDSQGKCHK